MLVLKRKKLLRNVTGLIVMIALAFFTISCSISPEQSQIANSGSKSLAQKDATGTPVAKYGQLKVVGNKVCDQNGNPVELRGMSMFWSQWSQAWWNASCIGNLASTWKISIIRAAMGVDQGGYLSDPNGETALVQTVVNAAVANGIYVIIDWHYTSGAIYQSQANSFFASMASQYKNTPNVLFEVYNEPDNTISWSSVKSYAQGVISAIRGAGANQIVIVGSPSWDQQVNLPAADPISGANIAYSLHFYAGSHGQWLRDVANGALSQGIALMVTEYGTSDASGNGNYSPGETQNWYNWMDQNQISSCNWEVFDKAETCAAFVGGASTTGPWPDSQLTTDGLFVKSYIIQNNNWGGNSGGGTTSSTSSTTTTTGAGLGKIEAENYTQMSGVQTEACSEGGLDVGWIDSGDWMVYPINVSTTGSYVVQFRVASQNGGGVLSLDLNAGSIQLGTVNIPSTGGWQNWTTVTMTVSLNAGSYNLGINAKVGGWNINWLNITTSSGSSVYDPNASYKIINKNAGRALSCYTGGTANTTPLILYDYISASDQQWQILDQGNGYYKIKNVRSGRLAGCLSGGTVNGTTNSLYDDVNATDQYWQILPGSTGYLKLINQRSGRAMCCDGGNSANNTIIHLWDYLGGYADQDWTISVAN